MTIVFFYRSHKGVLSILKDFTIAFLNNLGCFSKSLRGSFGKFGLCSKELHAVHKLLSEKSSQSSDCINFASEKSSCLVAISHNLENVADFTVATGWLDTLSDELNSDFDVGLVKRE